MTRSEWVVMVNVDLQCLEFEPMPLGACFVIDIIEVCDGILPLKNKTLCDILPKLRLGLFSQYA